MTELLYQSFSPVVLTVLHTLLNQYEQPNRQRAIRERLTYTKPGYRPYFQPDDPTPRMEANVVFRELAQQDLVRLRWSLVAGENDWLETVELTPSQAEKLYLLLNRTPKYDQETSLRTLLIQSSSQSGWYARFLRDISTRLDAHLPVAPFNLNDVQENTDLLKALKAIDSLDKTTLIRILSTQLFGDSKRLEKLLPAVIRVIRKYDKENLSFYGHISTRELLSMYYLERGLEYIPFAGPMMLQQNGTIYDLSLKPSIAIPTLGLYNVQIVSCTATCVVTVENKTSFDELVTIKPDSILVILTKGFASPAIMDFLRKLRACRPDLPFYHWGDIDVGGFRILAHLRKYLGSVVPVGMNHQTFEIYRQGQQGSLSKQERSRPLTKRDRHGFLQLLAAPLLADCQMELQYFLESERKLEQEAVRAKYIVETFVEFVSLT